MSRSARPSVIAVSILAVVWSAGIFVVPWLADPGAPARLLYAPVCHQLPERSLTIAGSPAAVCARCTGLYLGGTLGLLLVAAARIRLRGSRLTWLIVAVAPSVVDVAAGVVGLGGLPNVPRLLVALPAGVVLGLLLGEAVLDLASSIRERRKRSTLDVAAHAPCPRPQTDGTGLGGHS
ncbi:MAG: DUF2085 domain-containing protein [Acidobacteriota bacterium]|nr:DUF2085 domain-containing protein [Acidobacteriota bacterium]